ASPTRTLSGVGPSSRMLSCATSARPARSRSCSCCGVATPKRSGAWSTPTATSCWSQPTLRRCRLTTASLAAATSRKSTISWRRRVAPSSTGVLSS
ncbi:hypothetical protein HK405_002201, partial [Cladochytrium tenue]